VNPPETALPLQNASRPLQDASRMLFNIHPLVIGAVHLPPMPGSGHPQAVSVQQALAHAIRQAGMAVRCGVPAIYLQDLGDVPQAPQVEAHTIANLSMITAEIRRQYPVLLIGICLMSHAAQPPLAIAQAANAHFVRLKVYVGTMVKAEGVLNGCAYEAIQYRARLGAQDIAILADVYDRTGQPLGRMPLVEQARQAVVFGRADGLILTGATLDESLAMLTEVRQANLDVPLLLGGSASLEHLAAILDVADGIIVSSTFKKKGVFDRQGSLEEWDEARVQVFMQAVRTAAHP
jgi:membrane complex biogenesis BtpA family protein